MSFVAVGLFVIACGWNVYRLFIPTKAVAIRAEGHPQYFGAFLAAGYVAFLSVFLHAAAMSLPDYAHAIAKLARLAPPVVEFSNQGAEKSQAGDVAALPIQRETTIASRIGIIRDVVVVPAPSEEATNVDSMPTRADPYPILLGVGAWSAVLAVVLPFFLNLPFRLNKRANLLAGLKSANEVEQVLVEALAGGISVMITLITGKVYVGIPSDFDPNGAEPDWVRIWPLASGYRTKEGGLVLTTAYGSAYSKIGESSTKNGLSQDQFRILLPVEHVVSIQSFSLSFYIEHFARSGGDGQPGLRQALARVSSSRRISGGPISPAPTSDREKYPYSTVIPDGVVRSLKWIFHIALTVSIVALPFSWHVAALAAFVTLFATAILSDPTDENIRLLGEALKNI